MKIRHAAVFAGSAAERRSLTGGLEKAGLKISEARAPDQLSKEQLVVVGPGFEGPGRVARDIKRNLPQALLLAGQRVAAGETRRAAWADGVLPMPVSAADLQVRLPELLKLKTRPARRSGGEARPIHNEGIQDPLTHFYTFAHFKEVLFIEVKRARRYGIPLALALMELDPIEGRVDRELRTTLLGGLALAVRRSLRDIDYPVQYTSGRILLLMPHTDLQGALVVGNRICERVGKASLNYGKRVIRPTLSVGIAATQTGQVLSFGDIAQRAQAALAQAAASGGNRVEMVSAVEGEGEATEEATDG